MKIAITGATGLVGTRLVQLILLLSLKPSHIANHMYFSTWSHTSQQSCVILCCSCSDAHQRFSHHQRERIPWRPSGSQWCAPVLQLAAVISWPCSCMHAGQFVRTSTMLQMRSGSHSCIQFYYAATNSCLHAQSKHTIWIQYLNTLCGGSYA